MFLGFVHPLDDVELLLKGVGTRPIDGLHGWFSFDVDGVLLALMHFVDGGSLTLSHNIIGGSYKGITDSIQPISISKPRTVCRNNC